MTTATRDPRTARRTPARPVRRGPAPSALALTISKAALRAFAASLLVVELLAVFAWAADGRSGAGSGEALRAGALAWLVAHGATIAVEGGRFGLAPLGLTLLLAVFPLRAGAAVVRELQPRPPGLAAAVGAAVGIPYAVLAALTTAVARTPPARPAPWRVLLLAGLLASVAGALGAARARGWEHYAALVPERARLVGTGAAAALGTLAAGGAVGMAAALGWHLTRTADLMAALRPGLFGGLVLVLLCVAYLPNAVVWCVSFAVGTGFAVGVGTTVAPNGVTLGPLPAFPLLSALPASGSAPRPALLLLLVPVAAGVIAGLTVVRRAPELTAGRAAAWAALTGPATGVAVAVACVLASGSAGPGRLATTGPSPWLTGLAAAEWVTFTAAAVAAYAAGKHDGPRP
ncbi:MAG TPA: DUF6350 family protein [Frankiaceae bacterium]|nr:DUF6350 family protein [Frankiaceae bacterium]